MKRSTLILSAILALAAAAAARADLCARCSQLAFTADVGSCKACPKGTTTSGAFALCRACSKKLGQCESCRAALGGPAPAAGAPLAIGQEKNGKTVELPVAPAGILAIRLEGNPSTGFSWNLDRLEGSAVAGQGPIDFEESPSGRVGAGGLFIARFKAVKVGRSKIFLVYQRPWEKNVAPAKRFTITVVVKAAKNKR
ncbi:MAG: protease inhibitor I42 family protein [Candidatus Riflebacteria bacterium]|nr:protease inhibitor I42 family protein [Candidatus Riflebacteria bacterium]